MKKNRRATKIAAFAAVVLALFTSQQFLSAKDLPNSLTLGSSFSGRISEGDEDSFVFPAIENTRIKITIAPDRFSSLSPQAILELPDGGTMDLTSRFSYVKRTYVADDVILPANGQYTLILTGANDSSGAYNLGTAGYFPMIRYRSVSGARISSASVTESFTFSAFAGTTIDIDFRCTSGKTLRPKIELLNEDEGYVVRDFSKEYDTRRKRLRIRKLKLEKLGKYRLAVSSADGSTGGYRLSVQGDYPRFPRTRGFEPPIEKTDPWGELNEIPGAAFHVPEENAPEYTPALEQSGTILVGYVPVNTWDKCHVNIPDGFKGKALKLTIDCTSNDFVLIIYRRDYDNDGVAVAAPLEHIEMDSSEKVLTLNPGYTDGLTIQAVNRGDDTGGIERYSVFVEPEQ